MAIRLIPLPFFGLLELHTLELPFFKFVGQSL